VRIFAAAVGVAIVCGAAAQSPAVSPKEADEAKQQQARQITQPFNNQPLWSEIRSGQPQYTSVPGRETNILIQPQGQTWRALRVPVATGGGFLVAFALLVLAAFYLWRGPIVVHGPPTGRLIERFSVVERAVHWTVAIAFATLALSGLIISLGKAVLLPLIGYTLFSWLAILSKNLHNFVGPILVVALPIMIAVFVGENLPRLRLELAQEGWRHDYGRACTVGQGQCRQEDSVLADGGVTGPHIMRDWRDSRFPEFQPDAPDDAGVERGPHDCRAGRDVPAPGTRLSRHDRHEGRVGGDVHRLCR
jgi:hypothetical protein